VCVTAYSLSLIFIIVVVAANLDPGCRCANCDWNAHRHGDGRARRCNGRRKVLPSRMLIPARNKDQ
jgi:hypothetical protein